MPWLACCPPRVMGTLSASVKRHLVWPLLCNLVVWPQLLHLRGTTPRLDQFCPKLAQGTPGEPLPSPWGACNLSQTLPTTPPGLAPCPSLHGLGPRKESFLSSESDFCGSSGGKELANIGGIQPTRLSLLALRTWGCRLHLKRDTKAQRG